MTSAAFLRRFFVFVALCVAIQIVSQLRRTERLLEEEIKEQQQQQQQHNDASALEFSAKHKRERALNDTSPVLLWGIHSAHDQHGMRQAIREAYLNASNVCFIRDSPKRHCEVYYTFLIFPGRSYIEHWQHKALRRDEVIMEDPSLVVPSVEPDVTVLASHSDRRGIAWLSYASSSIATKLGLGQNTYIVHTNVDVVVWPELIRNMIKRKDEPEMQYRYRNEYPRRNETHSTNLDESNSSEVFEYGSVQIPFDEGPGNSPCLAFMSNSVPTACQNARGRLLFFSLDLAAKMVENVPIDDTIPFDQDADTMLVQLTESIQIHKRFALGFFGAYGSAQSIRAEWAAQEESRAKWADVRVIAVTGKFGAKPGQFEHQVAFRRNVMVAGGLHPDRIWAYDSFTPDMIDDSRWAKHLEFVYNGNASPRGGGYWFWKSVLILKALEESKMGDYVMYGDVDVPDDWSWKPDFLQTMTSRGHNAGVYVQRFDEAPFNKRDVYLHYCASSRDQATDKTKQYWGAEIMLQKTPGVMEFVRTWVRDAYDYHFISDSPSIEPNLPKFQEHRHDQSIMSLLLQCRYHNEELTPIRHPKAPPSYIFPHTMKIVPTRFQKRPTHETKFI